MLRAKTTNDGIGLRGRHAAPASRTATTVPAAANVHPRQSSCACGGTCPRCDGNRGIQKKLEVGRPDDRYEAEADRIGELVMRRPEPQGQQQGLPITPLIQRHGQDTRSGQDAPPIVNDVLSSPGQPLGRGARAFFEARFNRDFSNIRVHGDALAAESARAINARAYTIGRDVVFGAGEYAPGTEKGTRLLAHELTHAVQQDAVGEPDAAASKAVLQRSDGGVGAGGSTGGGKTIVLIAGGYTNLYGSEAAEVDRLKKKLFWQPGTEDFRQTASDTGIPFAEVTNESEFFGTLEDQAKKAELGSISRIVFIGHGRDDYLGLSGGFASTDKQVDAASLARWKVNIDENIKSKLASTATIDLFSCDAAKEGNIMESLAAAFGVCVRGYNDSVAWCIHYDPDSGKITRGRWAGVSADRDNCDAPGWNKGVASAAPPWVVCPPGTPAPSAGSAPPGP
jgi:hypothetical protein